jgi:hypothetical protein
MMARRFATVLVLGVLAAAQAGIPVSAIEAISQAPGTDLATLRERLASRFQVLPLANGVVLTPRFRSAVRSVEVTEVIAVDGVVVTGGELRNQLGADADLVLQVSYLDAAGRRAIAGTAPGAPRASQTPGQTAGPSPPAVDGGPPSRPVRRADIVRFGGNITVPTNETVSGDVVAIGGSADIDGQVEGEAVVIGGSLTLGPHADIRRDVTVVGGRLNRDPNAMIRGKLSEIGVGDAIRGGAPRLPGRRFGLRSAMTGFRFATTVVRVALVMLLASLVLLAADARVRQVADRAAAEPVKSWAVGFLVEILFVPLLVLTIVVLAVSIIGIPLLLLVPVAVLAALVLCLVGFTGVAFHLGRLLESRFERLRNHPHLATLAAIAVIVSPLLVARILAVVPGLGGIAVLLGIVGFLIEYVAWTTGLGALALTRLGGGVPVPMPAPTPAPPASPGT